MALVGLNVKFFCCLELKNYFGLRVRKEVITLSFYVFIKIVL